MPIFRILQRFEIPRPALFSFFCQPANQVAIAPPDLNLELVSGPSTLELHARVEVRARRWGLATTMVTEVSELVVPERIVERQIRGPFSSCLHVRTFVEVTPEITEVIEEVDFVPPGGVLGLTLTAARIEADLQRAYEGRVERVRERFINFSSARSGKGLVE